MRVDVTASNGQGAPVSIRSAATAIVAIPLAPENTQPPTISGTAKQGETLTANESQWSGAQPMTFSYQWQRCDAEGHGCQDIAGATQKTYVVRQADVGDRLVVVVKATNEDGSASAASEATAVVEATVAPGETIPVSDVSLPNQLLIADYEFLPRVLRSRAPFVARFRVADTAGHVVSGARVNLVVVPFGRVMQPGTVVTDSAGWATFTLVPTRKFPLVRGYRITMQARAVKPGDTPYSHGVTAWRLVTVAINPFACANRVSRPGPAASGPGRLHHPVGPAPGAGRGSGLAPFPWPPLRVEACEASCGG